LLNMSIVGHGIDIVEVSRIQRMLDEHGERFTHRCFSETERAYCEAGGRSRAERFAVRFACKEAVFKALGTGWSGGVSWTDVAVERDAAGSPSVVLAGECLRLARQRGIDAWHVSLSHTHGLAVASVIGSCSH
jgi:holo-[acyl-carrier protein] synthase